MPQKGYTRPTVERAKPLSKEKQHRDELREELEVAKAKAKGEGKEELDVEKYVSLRFRNDAKMLQFLKDHPREIEVLEIQYYLRHPEFKTIAEFVNDEIYQMGYA